MPFKWYFQEEYLDKWNEEDLYFSGFIRAVNSVAEYFFDGNYLQYLELRGYRVFCSMLENRDILVLITSDTYPQSMALEILGRTTKRFLREEISFEDDPTQRDLVKGELLKNVREVQAKPPPDAKDARFRKEFLESLPSQGTPQAPQVVPHEGALDIGGSGGLEETPKLVDLHKTRVELYRLQKKMASLGDLGRSIGHAINNAVGAIIGNITLAKFDAPAGTDLEKSLDDAADSCDRVKNLASQLLTIARSLNSPRETTPPVIPSGGRGEGGEELVRGTGRVLLMDDEKAILDTTSKMLEKLGYEVDVALDGAEAIALFEKQASTGSGYVAVILDLEIPSGMGADKTLKELKKLDPHVKSIISSGYAKDPVFNDYLRRGYKGAVKKPYHLTELSRVLHEVISSE
ncbi:MAG: response regulator [Promethearchaeota archaeon]